MCCIAKDKRKLYDFKMKNRSIIIKDEKLNRDYCPYKILLKSSLKLITSNLIRKKNTFYTSISTSILQNEAIFVFKSLISLLYSMISVPSASLVKRENLSERLFLLYFTATLHGLFI